MLYKANLVKLGLNLSSKLQENNERNNKQLWHKLCAFRCMREASGLTSFSDSNILVRNYLFLKNYVTSEGVVSLNFFFYQEPTLVLTSFCLFLSKANFGALPTLLVPATYLLQCTNLLQWSYKIKFPDHKV